MLARIMALRWAGGVGGEEEEEEVCPDSELAG